MASGRYTVVVRGVHLAQEPSGQDNLYDVSIRNGVVAAVTARAVDSLPPDIGAPEDEFLLDCGGQGIMLPSLAHAHVHLDKCFILDQCDELVSGNFVEALRVTAKAKAKFQENPDDIYARGKRLVEESILCGVTHMRAHVEVDQTVAFACLDVGSRLKDEFEGGCNIQLCAFAQDPLFSSAEDSDPGTNFSLLQMACERTTVSAVGSAPYVEPSFVQSKRNIDLILDLAFRKSKHADFHLDYNIDPSSEPLIFYLVKKLQERINSGKWTYGSWVTVGHATRLTLFSSEQWMELTESLKDLPLTFVGLPQSDLYMMGKRTNSASAASRNTLDPVESWNKYGLEIGLSVNNIDNAFTPQGTVDPLSLCTLGVVMFQSATPKDCLTLVKSVTSTSRSAMGFRSEASGLFPAIGCAADFVILHKNNSVQSVTLNPSYDRTTIKDGKIVARRVGCCKLTLSRS